MVPTATAGLRLAQFIQAQEKAVGINVVIQSTDFVSSLAAADAGNYDAFLIGWSGRVDPDGNIYSFVATPGSQNDSGYSNPKLDYVLNGARKSATTKSRSTLYHAAEQTILNDRPLIYLYYPVTRAGVEKTVGGRDDVPGHAASRGERGVQVRPRLADRLTMGGFLLRKVGAALVVLLLASMLVFLGVRAIPGDPAIALGAENRDPAVLAAVRHKYMLDRPLPVQYAHWLWLARPRRPRRRPARAPRLAHDRLAPPDLARARLPQHVPRDRDRHPGGGDRRGPARQSERLRRRRRSRSSASRCRTSGSACC